jgi:post-segregation antitoxin (ccd killing protein)
MERRDVEEVKHDAAGIVTLIDSDLTMYRKAHERHTVTLPSRLNHEAGIAGINVSATLQAALKSQLGI